MDRPIQRQIRDWLVVVDVVVVVVVVQACIEDPVSASLSQLVSSEEI